MIRVQRAQVFGWGALALSACTGGTSSPGVCGAPQGSSMAAESLASDDTAFAVAFYGPAVASAGAGQNVVVSPYSVSAALTMVDVGAAGRTATQMQTVLHLPDTGAKVAPAYAALACEDETDGSSQGNQLSIANSLWGQQGKTFESSFLSVLASGYSAPLQQVDFSANANGAMSTINQWVSNATQGKVPTLLHPGDVTGSTRLVLVDAVYFNGVWDAGFDPNKTSPQQFTLADGTMVSVPTMRGAVSLGAGSGGGASPGFSVYELPYKGRGLVMDFLLPNGSLSSLEASLTPDTLNGALASVGSAHQVILLLPKFSFRTHIELSPVLSGMGLPDVFDSKKADLSGMDGLMDLYVTAVVHEALVQVEEQGTVAAASTAASVGIHSCVCPSGPPLVAIDHPFMFLIRDSRNGSILFMGRVEDPRQA